MFSLCRLCAKSTDNIELVAQIPDLQSKLSMCCGWKLSENESKMPQNVCNQCVDRLERSWEFAEAVWAAEQNLYELTCELDQTKPDECIPEAIEMPLDTIKTESDFSIIETGNWGITIDEVTFDQSNDSSDDESIERQSPNKSTTESSGNKNKEHPDTHSFLNALDDEDRVKDGTINEKGIAKLQKLFPEMLTMSWIDCQYKCDKCNRTFNGPQSFSSHLRSIHSADMPAMQLRCFYCVVIYHRDHMLNRHIGMDHFVHLGFKCWYCTEYFWDTRKLAIHRKQHKDVEFKCEMCGHVLGSRDSLNTHIAQLHLKQHQLKELPRFTCDICSKDFCTKGSIKGHMLQHTIKKLNFVCDQCGQKFLTNGTLKGHLDTVHSEERPFQCNQCDMKFKTKPILKSHSIIHQELKPWECPTCSKKYLTKHRLSNHMRIHSNDRPYACKYCSYKSRHLNNLKIHERTHTSERPYPCNHCDYQSVNWSNLNKHSMRIHSIDLRKKKKT